MTVQPAVLYRNILRVSQEGRGDGTVYATATGATVDQDAKTFTLSGLSIISDIGADADDKFNGYELYFTSSERSYLIVDWTAATDLATVYDVPNVADTGACEIRRTLHANDCDTGYPARFACSGDLNKPWVGSAANQAVSIVAALPNFFDDGGFESGVSPGGGSSAWSYEEDDTGASATANSFLPLLGTYSLYMVPSPIGSLTWNMIYQGVKVELKAGRTYAIRFKAKRDSNYDANPIEVYFRYADSGATVTDITWSNLGTGDTQSSGIWEPQVSTGGEWKSATFEAPDDFDVGNLECCFKVYINSAIPYNFEIDEISGYEVLTPDTFIVGNHNWFGSLPSSSYIRGCFCPHDRSSINTSDYDDLLDLDANVSPTGKSPIYETFTQPTDHYPIFVISIAAQSGRTWEAGEIWLGERWTWEKFITGNFIPTDGRLEINTVTTIGGVPKISERYRKKRRGGNLVRLTYSEANRWAAFFKEVGKDKQFWYRFPGISALGIDAETLFMRCVSEPRPFTTNLRYDVAWQFEEM